MKNFIILIFLFGFIQAEIMQSSKNYTLYVKKLIQKEEKIAEAYEAYLLEELEVPTIEKLISKQYLLKNFNQDNILEYKLEILQNQTLRLNYAIDQKNKKFLHNLYQSNLFRQKTQNIQMQYILITLESKEAKNILTLLNTGMAKISPCKTSNHEKNTFCSVNARSFRFYDDSNNWIEYNKKEFKDGNIIIKNSDLLENLNLYPSIRTQLQEQKVGSFIFVKNSNKYIKLKNNVIKRVQ